MTTAEFLAWDAPGPQIWQLVDGEPQAMAPASRTHGAIQNELGRLIGNHLADRGSACTVVTTPGIVPHVRSDMNFRIPDLAVTCSGCNAEETALSDPVLLIEILSPSDVAETRTNIWA
jgi:Uma2 family endonuclease